MELPDIKIIGGKEYGKQIMSKLWYANNKG